MPNRIRALAATLALAAAPLFAAEPLADAAPAGDTVSFAYAVYFAGTPDPDPIARVRAHADVASGSVTWLDKLPDHATVAMINATVVEDAQTELPPPQGESLQYFTNDLSDTETQALQKASRVLVLAFAHPAKDALPALARADRIAYDLARQLNGVLYDVELRRAVGAARWRSGRLESDGLATPSILEHAAIHAYRDSEWVRAVTVGMRKLGLPELAVDELSASSNMPIGWLMNSIGQRLIEGQRPDGDGWFDLDLRAIQLPAVREGALPDLKSNGTARGRFKLVPAAPEEGDADNRLLAIGFQAYEGPDVSARQNAAISALFGWNDAVKYIDHDDNALEAASQHAREKLPALRKMFQRGLKPGELIQVKLPFEVPDGGNEWMWVEVLRWNGDTIDGVLSNEPFNIPDLHAGQRVTGSTSDVFDYIYRWENGEVEGNETGAIIERMQGEESRRGGE
jgi:uncharacterized protein YegJ (DUF2314 family)